ncbi:MAG: hypothetical protein ACI849_000256 [Patiriisocius sp.]|jgi:hypothetical protein
MKNYHILNGDALKESFTLSDARGIIIAHFKLANVLYLVRPYSTLFLWIWRPYKP